MNFKKLLIAIFVLISTTINASESIDLYVDSAHFDDGDKIPYVFTPSKIMPPKYILIMRMLIEEMIFLKILIQL